MTVQKIKRAAGMLAAGMFFGVATAFAGGDARTDGDHAKGEPVTKTTKNDPVGQQATTAGDTTADLPDGLYARMVTNRGEIIIKLEMNLTPMTVMNFAGLAEGVLTNSFRKGQPYYDGIVFHRVLGGFMAQGGDPTGKGTGGPGYRFPNEIVVDLTHDAPGILSMANAGPDTNGSQFFLTFRATPHLDGRHTVFGRVVRGLEVLNKIKLIDPQAGNGETPDRMERVEIIRIGAAAQAFRPSQEAFDILRTGGGTLNRAEPDAVAERLRANQAAFQAAGVVLGADWFPTAIDQAARATKSPKGSLYTVLQEGTGAKPNKGQAIAAHYTGRLLTGWLFDTSRTRGDAFSFKVGQGQVIPAWDEMLLDMKVGEKRALFAPYNQAYGADGMPGAIPPKAMLYFEVERVR